MTTDYLRGDIEMVKATVAASILYFAIVFFLSFLLEKLHIITKPPLKKGFFLSALFYIGIVLTVLGIYFYESSKVIGGLCCLAGVIIGVLKTSSDSLRVNAGQTDSGAMKRNLRQMRQMQEMRHMYQIPRYAG